MIMVESKVGQPPRGSAVWGPACGHPLRLVDGPFGGVHGAHYGTVAPTPSRRWNDPHDQTGRLIDATLRT